MTRCDAHVWVCVCWFNMNGVPSAPSPCLTPEVMYKRVSFFYMNTTFLNRYSKFFLTCATSEYIDFYSITKSTTDFNFPLHVLLKTRLKGSIFASRKNNVANLKHGMALWNAKQFTLNYLICIKSYKLDFLMKQKLFYCVERNSLIRL